MREIEAKILSNTEVKPGIFNIVFAVPEICDEARPGHFVFVKIEGQGAPLLRRAFGIYRATKSGTVEILFKVVGEGTKILSQKPVGEKVRLSGPCGNGFDVKKGCTHLIAGGGMGVAPLMFLVDELKAAGEEMHIFTGARTERELLCYKEMGLLCPNITVTTDDGTLGEKTFVSVPLEEKLKVLKNAVIYACGPHPMLKTIAALGAKYNAQTQVSLEEKMGCALGVCQGCPVEVKNKDTKYKMVCKDGPVFMGEDIVW